MRPIHWRPVLIAAFGSEAAMLIVLIPITFTGISETTLNITVSLVCLLLAFAFGLWSARKVDADFILHGSLVGLIAALIYMVIVRDPTVYAAANALKIAGGAAGGFIAERQKKPVAESRP